MQILQIKNKHAILLSVVTFVVTKCYNGAMNIYASIVSVYKGVKDFIYFDDCFSDNLRLLMILF